MKSIRFICLTSLVFSFWAVHVQFTAAQSTFSAQPLPSLDNFFETLVQHYDPSSLPKYDDVLKVVDQIPGTRAEAITKAIPAIFRALSHPDENVATDAAFALTVICYRPDCGMLLKDRIREISTMFDSLNPRLQGIPAVIFSNMKPLPPEGLRALVSFLRRTDRDQVAQAGAVFALVRLAPDKPEVMAAIQEFLSRPLDSNSRVGALNALGTPGVNDTHLIAMVISSLDDADHGVRLTAIRALTRMGPNALPQAQVRLQQLAEDHTQPADIRAAAKEALRVAGSASH